MVDGGIDGSSPTWRWAVKLPLLLALLAMILRAWAPGPVVQTFDERSWSGRSVAFREAVRHLDLDRATAAPEGQLATMPGVTTMWSGTIGWNLADLGAHVGLVDRTERGSPEGTSVLRASHLVVAFFSSLTLWAIIVMVALLYGRRVGLIVGLLLAVEPWLVGHSGILHTDAYVTMFSFAGFVALAVAGQALDARVGVDDAEPPAGVAARGIWGRAGTWAVVSGAFFGLAMLTKLNALVLVGGALVALPLASWATHRRRGDGALAARARRWAVLVAIAGAVTLVVFVVLWPATWVSPMTQLSALRRSATQADDPNGVFFAGRSDQPPGLWFYPVATLFRISPWLLLSAAAAAVVSVWRRVLVGPVRSAVPGFTAAVVAVLGVYVVIIATAEKIYDRYALVLVPFLAVGVAVAAVRTFDVVAVRRPTVAAGLRSAGFVGAALVSIYVLTLAPYSISYADPVVGGQAAARHWIPLGWGEGIETAGEYIRTHEGEGCADVTISIEWFVSDAVPCGRLVGGWNGEIEGAPDYAVVYVLKAQRGLNPTVADALRTHGTLVASQAIGGEVYMELWRIQPGT